MKTLLNPKSIAIIGASKKEHIYTGRTLKNLLKYGYSGKIYPVNPKHKNIMGVQCFRDIKKINEKIDCAWIQISGEKLVKAIEDCVMMDIRSIVIHSAKFGIGKEEENFKNRVTKLLENSETRICGPNSIGLINTVTNTALSPVATLDSGRLIKGRLGLVSQSGGMMGAILSRSQARGLGFSYLLSTGNEIDLDVSDYVKFMLNDQHTDIVLLYLEGIKNVGKFKAVAELAIKKKKPIIVLKVGKTEPASKAAKSHTGAISGDDNLYEGFFKQYGILRVRYLEDLIETSSFMMKYNHNLGENIGVLTTSGGASMIVVDECSKTGFKFPELSKNTVSKLQDSLPSIADISNPMDVTLAGVGETFGKAINIMINDQEFNILIIIIGNSSQFNYEENVHQIVNISNLYDKPIMVFLNPAATDALRHLEENGIPTCRTPEACARILANINKYHKLRSTIINKTQIEKVMDITNSPTANSLISNKNFLIDEYDSKKIMNRFGIPTVEERIANNINEAVKYAKEIGYPVAAKILSSDIAHKNYYGLVEVNVFNEESLIKSIRNMFTRYKVANKQNVNCRILIQKMVYNGIELIAGVSRDKQFGSFILFGKGGSSLEFNKDISNRVLPIGKKDAEDMIRDTKIYERIRNHDPRRVYFKSIVTILLKISQIWITYKKYISDIEINPLIVDTKNKRISAVDALIIKI